jgi:hypothetical protein
MVCLGGQTIHHYPLTLTYPPFKMVLKHEASQASSDADSIWMPIKTLSGSIGSNTSNISTYYPSPSNPVSRLKRKSFYGATVSAPTSPLKDPFNSGEINPFEDEDSDSDFDEENEIELARLKDELEAIRLRGLMAKGGKPVGTRRTSYLKPNKAQGSALKGSALKKFLSELLS